MMFSTTGFTLLLTLVAISVPLSSAAPVNSSSVLETRSAQSCKTTSQCTASIPSHSSRTCKSGRCGYACSRGYTLRGRQCQKNPSTSSSSGTILATNSNMVDARISQNGITGFGAPSLSWNTNAIASWFHTNSGQDSTNGHSWCYNPYDDSMPGFAPDVSVMLKNFGGSNTVAGAAYCGLEAEFVAADGRTATLILMDGFDHQWVRTPSSIDVIYNAFGQLHGSTTNDKNVVETGVKWRFTGRRDSRYVFNSRK